MHKIIHRIAVCGLILLMSFKLLGGFSYNLYFWYNQKELAREHCINQDRPKMKCNGKCYLAKQLAKIENDYQKKQRRPAPFQIKASEWFFIHDVNTKYCFDDQLKTKQASYFEYLPLQSNSFSKIPTPPPNFV